MEIMDSALGRDIRAVFDSGEKPVHFNWIADLHAGGYTFRALKVISIDTREEYVNNFTAEIVLKVAMGAGTYAYDIYPNLANMEITLYKMPLKETADVENEEAAIRTERYAVTPLDQGQPAVESNTTGTVDKYAMDLTNVVEVNFQLHNKAVVEMLMRTVGGIWRNCLLGDVVKTILTNESLALSLPSDQLPKGVQMVEATNVSVQDHVVIPHATRLVDMPGFIHNSIQGIYGAGFSWYYKDSYWYIYPTYDLTRFDKVDKTLRFINIPSKKMPGIDRTYLDNNGHVTILCTGDVKMRATSEALQMNQGNGVRFADASKFMNSFVDVSDNVALVSRGKNNNEFVTGQRTDGRNNVQASAARITGNPLAEYGRMAAREGNEIILTWEHSDPSYITPGIPAKFVYLEGENIRELDGLILNAHHYDQMAEKTLVLDTDN
jgi:hypothetical protein